MSVQFRVADSSLLALRDLVQRIYSALFREESWANVEAEVDPPDLPGGLRAYRLLGAPTEVLSASTSVDLFEVLHPG